MDINWTIDNLEWNADTNLLVLAYWTVTGQDGEYSYSYSGTARFPDDPDEFGIISMEDMTEEKAIAAVKANLSDIYNIEAFVRGEVEKQNNYAPLVTGLPWTQEQSIEQSNTITDEEVVPASPDLSV